MSLEAFVIAGAVQEGTPKKIFQAGFTADDFDLFQDEFLWMERRIEQHLPINVRSFRSAWPDFEWVPADERLQDLLDEYRQERAYVSLHAAMEQIMYDLEPENAIDKAVEIREISGDVLKAHSRATHIDLTTDVDSHLEMMKSIRLLSEQGKTFGISTGYKNLDHHWGGLMPGRFILCLGRPGDMKSMFLSSLATNAMLEGYRVGIFSPEMNEFEHNCRIHTLISADKQIQQELGLRGAFRNRALMEGRGFNWKTYRKFCQYLTTLDGHIFLFTQKYRRQKMAPAFIESRVEELGLDMVLIDPIYKLRTPRKRALKHEELGDITDSIQDIAKAFNIPIVASNQAHRLQGRSRSDAPHKDSSYGSDAPTQEADHVIGTKYYDDERLLVLRCTKNRFGQDFRVEVKAHPNIGRLEDITPIKGDYFNTYDDDKADDLRETLQIQKEIEQEEANADNA